MVSWLELGWANTVSDACSFFVLRNAICWGAPHVQVFSVFNRSWIGVVKICLPCPTSTTSFGSGMSKITFILFVCALMPWEFITWPRKQIPAIANWHFSFRVSPASLNFCSTLCSHSSCSVQSLLWQGHGQHGTGLHQCRQLAEKSSFGSVQLLMIYQRATSWSSGGPLVWWMWSTASSLYGVVPARSLMSRQALWRLWLLLARSASHPLPVRCASLLIHLFRWVKSMQIRIFPDFFMIGTTPAHLSVGSSTQAMTPIFSIWYSSSLTLVSERNGYKSWGREATEYVFCFLDSSHRRTGIHFKAQKTAIYVKYFSPCRQLWVVNSS